MSDHRRFMLIGYIRWYDDAYGPDLPRGYKVVFSIPHLPSALSELQMRQVIQELNAFMT